MNNLSLEDQIKLANIISVFNKINVHCAESEDYKEGFVPFSSNPETVEYYQ